MAGDAGDITHPTVIRFQVAIGLDELSRHVMPHPMHLEDSKHLVGVAQVLIEKANVRGRRLGP